MSDDSLRRDIAVACERMAPPRPGVQETTALAALLNGDEAAVRFVRGSVNGVPGLVVLTSRRIVHQTVDAVHGLASVQEIREVSWSAGPTHGFVRVRTSTRDMVITDVPNTDGAAFTAAVQSVRAVLGRAGPATETGKGAASARTEDRTSFDGDDAYEHLRKLGFLYQAGILTQAEFIERKIALLSTLPGASVGAPLGAPADPGAVGPNPPAPVRLGRSRVPQPSRTPPDGQPVGNGMLVGVFATLGLGTPLVLWHAHSYLRTRKARKAAILYSVLLAIVLLFSVVAPFVSAVAMLWIWIGGSIRVFDSISEINAATRSGQRSLAVADPNVIAEQQVHRRRRLRAEARRIAESDAGYARELGIGRPDLRGIFDDGGLIDVNTAPAPVLSCLPGVAGPTAQRIVDHRSAHGRLMSAVEVSAVFDLDPRVLSELAEFTVFT